MNLIYDAVLGFVYGIIEPCELSRWPTILYREYSFNPICNKKVKDVVFYLDYDDFTE